MTQSWTVSDTTTFTITHARHLATKVSADLCRMRRYYGAPSAAQVDAYEDELIQLLKEGVLATVWYGFKRDGMWIEPTLRYSASELFDSIDDDPGRVPARANVERATFHSYLTYNSRWDRLTLQQREAISARLPFQRSAATEPGVNGYLHQDRAYSSGGRMLQRSIVRGY